MVQAVFHGSRYGHDLPLGVSLKVQDRLEGMAPEWPNSPAAVALRELQQVQGGKLPQDSAELFAVLLANSQDELVRLLAVCVAGTVDVVTPRATPQQQMCIRDSCRAAHQATCGVSPHSGFHRSLAPLG